MKKLKLNMVVALVSNLVYILAGIVAQRFILRSYGSEINGLTGSVNQFLAYMTLLEAGLGTASIQALYKPLANKDTKAVEGILAATSRQYQRIGVVFLSLTVILAAAMPVITNSSLDAMLVFGVTLLMGAGSAVNYLFIGRYQVLLTADRNVYVLSLLNSILGTLFTIVRIVMINMGLTIVAVQSVALVSPLVRIVVLRIYFKCHYPHLSYKAKPDFGAISKRRFVFVHQIVGMVNTQIGVTVLTVFASLSQVSVYSVYNLIYSNIRSLISSTFATAVEPSFGKLVGAKDAHLGEYYKYYELLFTFFLSWVLTAALVMTIPFVWLYTVGAQSAEVNYIDSVLAVLFMLSIFINLVRIPSLMMVNVSGAFQETQKGAIIEAALNMGIAIPAFFLIGMRGLLLGSCVSLFYRMLDIETYVYRNVLKVRFRRWVRLFAVNLLAMVSFVTMVEVTGMVHYGTWLQWLLSGIFCAAVGAVFYLAFMFVFYPRETRKILSALAAKLRKKPAVQ